MFNSTLIYRIAACQLPEHSELERRLDKARFVECGASTIESFGWVPPRGDKHVALIEGVGGQLILKWCAERKMIPATVIKAQLEQRLAKIEAETGSRPRGKQAKELKEDVFLELLPRAFAKRTTTAVWLDMAAQRIVVGTASLKTADAISTALVELLGPGLSLKLLQTKTAPASAMSFWLREHQAPAGFGIDRECELKQPDSEKSVVRYARHNLDIDEVAMHIQQGKLPTQLAMTWGQRVSFVLGDSMALKKIKLLDAVLDDQAQTAADKSNNFDADIAILTGELSRLFPDLLEALDGELELDTVQQS